MNKHYEKKSIFKHELIGLKVKIIESDNKSLINLKGEIIDETKNVLKIKTEKKIKMVLKNQIKIKVDNIVIDGKKLVGRPEERIKK